MKTKSILPFVLFSGIIVMAACKKSRNSTAIDNRFRMDFSGDSTVGKTVIFSSSLGNDPYRTFLWTFGDGTTSSEVGATHIYSVSMVYTVTLTINNDTSTRKSRVIFIKPNYDFEVIGVPVTSGLLNFKLIYPQSPGTVFHWSFGDGSISTDSFSHHTYTSEGYYNVTLYAGNDSSNIAQKTIRICSDPVYTHMLAGNHLWTGKKIISFVGGSEYDIDTAFDIEYIDPLTISVGDKRLYYVPDSTCNGILFYGNDKPSYEDYTETLSFNRLKDSIGFYKTYDVPFGQKYHYKYEYILHTP